MTFTTAIVFMILSIARPVDAPISMSVMEAFQMATVEECHTASEAFNKAAIKEALEDNPDATTVEYPYWGICVTTITSWKDQVSG